MQLLGRVKFLTEDENPKGKVKFLKGGEFPRNFAPWGAILLGISLPWGSKLKLGNIPGTPAPAVKTPANSYLKVEAGENISV
jgi:hypothetical protein